MATKVALVTASSAGVGAAIAKALAPHFRVVVNYFSRPEKAAEVLRECEAAASSQTSSSQRRFHSIQADVAKRSEVQRLVEETVQEMGRLDVVVSNAGWTRVVDFFNLEENVSEEDWDRCFNMNVKAHLWLLHAAKPHLEANEDGGSFVTVASLAGVRPSGSSLPYAVTKAAAIHLTKGLAITCAPKIRCNSVSPVSSIPSSAGCLFWATFKADQLKGYAARDRVGPEIQRGKAGRNAEKEPSTRFCEGERCRRPSQDSRHEQIYDRAKYSHRMYSRAAIDVSKG